MDTINVFLNKYTNGKGLDISENNNFEFKIKKLKIKLDNFFSLKEEGIEKWDFVLCDDLIQKTKYLRILIKEVFYSLKKNGFFIIHYCPRNLSVEDLEKEIFISMKDSIDIVDSYISDKTVCIVIQKKQSNKSKPENINEWTFGIVTRGTTDNIVDEIIETIKIQNIPKYEIIICGKYAGKYKKEIEYIEFMQKDDLGWITRKKNLICEKAKYENILVMHDRIKLKKNWFNGMKKYGNNWDILSTQILKDNKRTYDWITTKYPLENIKSKCYLGSNLEYSDWDKWIYIDGGVIILKKYVWEKVNWDDKLYYGEGEDVKLSHDQTRYGFLIRFNPYSIMESFRFNHPFSKISVKKNIKKYGSLKGPLHLVFAKKMRGYTLYLYYTLKTLFKK